MDTNRKPFAAQQPERIRLSAQTKRKLRFSQRYFRAIENNVLVVDILDAARRCGRSAARGTKAVRK
jgi:hypothetical protein